MPLKRMKRWARHAVKWLSSCTAGQDPHEKEARPSRQPSLGPGCRSAFFDSSSPAERATSLRIWRRGCRTLRALGGELLEVWLLSVGHRVAMALQALQQELAVVVPRNPHRGQQFPGLT